MKVRIRKAQNGIQVENNAIKAISPSFGEILGKPHSEGGTDVTYAGQTIEAQRNEPVAINQQGSLVFFGKLKDPVTGKNFESAAKDLATQENKALKASQTGNDLITQYDPYSPVYAPTFNSGVVIADAANQNLNKVQGEKEQLGQRQQIQLDEKYQKSKAQQGAALPLLNQIQQPVPTPNLGRIERLAQQADPPKQEVKPTIDPKKDPQGYVQQSIINAAIAEGVDPDLMERISYQESGFRPGVKGVQTKYGTAHGHVQFLPGTAKEYGLTEAQLKSKKPEDIDAVSRAGAQHMRNLIQKHYGDRALALAEYNGGQKAIEDGQKALGKKDITGRELLSYWQSQNEKRPSDNPNLYRNQTLNYVTNILDTPKEEFYSGSNNPGKGDQFRQTYYNGIEGTRPPQVGEMTQDQFQAYRQRNDVQIDPISPGLTTPQPISTPQPIGVPMTRQQLPTNSLPRETPERPRSPRNSITPLDYLPEIAAILDRPDYVEGQQYTPELLDPYRVSFQDRINQNQGTFNAISRNLQNNPEALSTLAAQAYQQNQGVLAEEFRTNQGIANQVANQNNQILNQAELTNIGLADTQYQRQAQAAANTEAGRNAALASISNKYAQNRAINNTLDQVDQRTRYMENFFNYRADPVTGQYSYQGPDAVFNTSSQGVDPTSGMDQKTAQEYWRAQRAQEQYEAQALKNQQAARKLTEFKFGGIMKNLKSK